VRQIEGKFGHVASKYPAFKSAIDHRLHSATRAWRITDSP